MPIDHDKDAEIMRLKKKFDEAVAQKEAAVEYARQMDNKARDDEEFMMFKHGYRGQD